MEMSCKSKGHVSCSCKSCVYGRSRPYGQTIHKLNEKKLRRIAKQELRKALRETDRDQLEECDFPHRIGSPYTD